MNGDRDIDTGTDELLARVERGVGVLVHCGVNEDLKKESIRAALETVNRGRSSSGTR